MMVQIMTEEDLNWSTSPAIMTQTIISAKEFLEAELARYDTWESIRSDELHEQLGKLASRTIGSALSSLKEKGLVKRYPDLMDARRGLYTLTEGFASRLKARMEAHIAP